MQLQSPPHRPGWSAWLSALRFSSFPACAYTEYQREVKVCHQVHRRRYPAGVSAGASYGANYQGLMSYLMQRQFIPFERLAALSHELLGHRPSEGSLYRLQRRLFERLAGVEQAIRSSESVLASLQEADLTCAETGCYLKEPLGAGGKHPDLYSFRRTPADRDLAILGVVPDQYASYYEAIAASR